MSTPERKPSHGGDFRPGGESPEKLTATLRESQQLLLRSTAWPIVALDHASVGEGLRQQSSIAIEACCGLERESGQRLARRGTLRRLTPHDTTPAEFELRFAEPLPGDWVPLAVYTGKLNIWQFEPLALESAKPLRLPESQTAEAGEPAALSLAAAGGRPEGVLESANERLRLRWSGNQLQIILDQPPLRRGQPVIVEVLFDDDGRQRRYLRAVSTDFEVTHGDDTGFVWGAIDCYEPGCFKRFRIAARPLAPEELDVLDSGQLGGLLAGQQMSAMTMKPDGRFSARSDQQLRASADPASTWFLRVARKEVRQ